jgi:hypothetical protein
MLDISTFDRAEVLARLYNAAKPQGLGFLPFDPKPMTTEEAKAYLDAGQTRFDYLNGRVMKVNLSSPNLDNRLYDRDNGEGAAAEALGIFYTNPKKIRVTVVATNPEESCELQPDQVWSAEIDIEGNLDIQMSDGSGLSYLREEFVSATITVCN